MNLATSPNCFKAASMKTKLSYVTQANNYVLYPQIQEEFQ